MTHKDTHGSACTCHSCAPAETATVVVDGRTFTGAVYHVRENGWPCVKTPSGHVASGPRA